MHDGTGVAKVGFRPGRSINHHLIVNGELPLFDNAELRRAMPQALDRHASIDVISQS